MRYRAIYFYSTILDRKSTGVLPHLPVFKGNGHRIKETQPNGGAAGVFDEVFLVEPQDKANITATTENNFCSDVPLIILRLMKLAILLKSCIFYSKFISLIIHK